MSAEQIRLLERKDLGEAAEWQGKSLNVLNRNSDDEFEFEKNSSDEEFNAIGLGKTPQPKIESNGLKVDES